MSNEETKNIEEIKGNVESFFKKNKNKSVDTVDLANEFKDIPFPYILEACSLLEKENKILRCAWIYCS